ncbi:MAG: 3-isopropylmalate dehydratase large subunit [Calditrichaeota bacterium]|nr:3-isopropylmalate dehydratase large subunit [Calditrichota bacterium]
MPLTLIEKILAAHAGKNEVKPEDLIWLDIDYRSARDFGGPNVVEQLERRFSGRLLSDPAKTYFTFDTNAPANTTGYADNQHKCRLFARRYGARLFDVDSGIGTHIAIEQGLVNPADTAVGTDSHFNILSAVGAFGQGMGDLDVAYIFRAGRTWFEVPHSVKVVLNGALPKNATAKDLGLFLLRELGTEKALGKAVELNGECIESLDLAGRITVASLATEAGAIAFFLPPSPIVSDFYRRRFQRDVHQIWSDEDAIYDEIISYDVNLLTPMASPPPSPNGACPVNEFNNIKVDSVFVGSCTNGRWEDFRAVADILTGRKVKDGVMLRMVPATREVYLRILEDGTLADLVKAGAIISQAGCGGCASGQIGMTGKGEVQVSTSNRNFRGKQGLGDTYLASPITAAWSALRGTVCNENEH